MKRENVNYFWVGLLVLAALVLFLGALYFFTGRSGAVDRYNVRYRNVSGLNFGTAVFYQGYRIGQVQSITPEHVGTLTTFKVELGIARGWAIPDDATASLLASGLLSDVMIGISQGKSNKALPAGSEIAGREGGDIFATVGELAGEVGDITRTKLRPLLDKVSTSLDAVSGKLEVGAPTIIDDTIRLLKQLNHSADSVNDIVGPQNRANLSALLANADQASGHLAKLSGDLGHTRQELDEMVSTLNATVKESRPDVQYALADLREALSSVAQRIDTISENLESASRNFDEFSRDIRRTPNRLLFSPSADKLKDDAK
jgi:phospholipid/cholesterol/gamma-HCH transport system substrate-binding protein